MGFNLFFWRKTPRETEAAPKQLDRIESYLQRIVAQGEAMSKALLAEIDNLNVRITKFESVQEGLIAQDKGLAELMRKSIDSAPDDATALQNIRELANKIDKDAQKSADAVLANTDVDGTTDTTPVLNSINPPFIAAGSADFLLDVKGSGFVKDSVVQVNGAARNTVFVDATKLSATVLAGDVATTGGVSVNVVNPGGSASDTVSLTVNPA